ncbi:hypothetical protein JW935_18780 [candidate division KSB1 bacterium]|nr:hypothetical protein [candidate division KSB1 bacterium]
MRYISCAFIAIAVFFAPHTGFSQAKTTIAVLNFEAKNVGQETADAVADILSTELFNTNRFRVIERTAIAQLLQEHQLQMTGVTDMSQAAELGKVLNAEKIMIGSVSRLGQTYIINTRLVDVQTGALELAQNTKSENGEEGLPAAIGELARVISQKIVVEGAIIKITTTTILVDLGKAHGVKVGQNLEVIRVGEVVTDLNGAVIGKTEDKVGVLKVKTVRDEFCETEIVESKLSFQLGDKVRITTTAVETKPQVIQQDNSQKYKYKKIPDEDEPVEPPPVF